MLVISLKHLLSLSLLTISLSRQWDLSLCCDSLSLSLSHSPGYNYGFWTARGFLFIFFSPQIGLTNHWLIYLFLCKGWMWEMNSRRVQVPLGQSLFPRLFCIPAVCELFTAVRAAVIWETHLQTKMLQWLLPPFSLPPSSFQFPFSPIPFFSSHVSSLPSPQYFASTTSSFSFPLFCLLGIPRMMSESPSLLKIHCQINIKAGKKIQLALCDLSWSATQDPGLPTSQGYEGLGDPQLLETPWWGQIPSSSPAWMRWVGQERKNVKTKTSPCFFSSYFFFLLRKNWHKKL